MKLKLIIVCLLAIILLSACGDSGKVADLEAQVATLTAQHESLEEEHAFLEQQSTAEIQNLNGQISTLEHDKAVYIEENSKLNDRIKEMYAELTDTQAKLAQLQSASGSDVSTLTAQINSLNNQIANLRQQMTPSPDHALPLNAILSDPTMRSSAWVYDDAAIKTTVENIGRQYYASHVYVDGEYDCDNMAMDLWDMLLTQKIKSVIAVGNLDKPNAAYLECTHVWLCVFTTKGDYFILEPTTGQVFYKDNPGFVKYATDYYYLNPFDMFADIFPCL